MSTTKEPIRAVVERILNQLPEDASIEDLQYHLYVCQAMQAGLDDIAAGRTFTQEEVEARMEVWLKESFGRSTPN
jgi:predicted transcriptional regulator